MDTKTWKKLLHENELNEEMKFKGKTGYEWIKMIRDIPYDDLMEWAEMSQYPKLLNLLDYMKKKMKYI